VHLNATGRQQAQRLAEALAGRGIQQIFSSPLERARETAEPLAARLQLPVQISPPLLEADFGDWTGKAFAELEHDERWRQWNTLRSLGRIPNGESMLEIQHRVVVELERLRWLFANQTLALFGHGDPLRSALVHYLGMPLDLLLRLEMSTACWSVVCVDDWQVKVLGVNRGA
jgi:broad specificity phosphatase PhoE